MARKGLATTALVSILAGTVLWPPSGKGDWHEEALPFGGELRDVSLLEQPRPAPDYAFLGPDGQTTTLADFRGKTVFVNFWATWCPPCVEEMPALDRLQAELGGERFAVLPLSLDRSRDVVEDSYQRIGLKHLSINLDTEGQAMMGFRAGVLPTPLIIGPRGNLIGGLAGPAEWDSAAALAFARYFIRASPR